MILNHLKIAFRQLSRNKVFSTLNILGLSLGMALAILIVTFIKSEFSYDTWMTDSENTYRVYRVRGNSTAWTPPRLAQKMSTDYPEVMAVSGFAPTGERLLTFDGKDMRSGFGDFTIWFYDGLFAKCKSSIRQSSGQFTQRVMDYSPLTLIIIP